MVQGLNLTEHNLSSFMDGASALICSSPDTKAATVQAHQNKHQRPRQRPLNSTSTKSQFNKIIQKPILMRQVASPPLETCWSPCPCPSQPTSHTLTQSLKVPPSEGTSSPYLRPEGQRLGQRPVCIWVSTRPQAPEKALESAPHRLLHTRP